MMPTLGKSAAPIPPPAFHRAQVRPGPALHVDALTRVEHLTPAHPLPSGCTPGSSPMPPSFVRRPRGAPRTYCEESLLLLALLRTLWRLSYQDMHDWLRDWPALACGLPIKDGRPRIPCPSRASGSAAIAPEHHCRKRFLS